MGVYVDGNIRRIVMARFGPGEDLLDSIISVCRRYDIINGCVLFGIGSLAEGRLNNPVPVAVKNNRIEYKYPPKPQPWGGPYGAIELLNVQGTIWHTGNGEIRAHVHITCSTSQGNAIGGHLVPGNIVLTTAEILIAEFANIDMIHENDEDAGVPLLQPQKT